MDEKKIESMEGCVVSVSDADALYDGLKFVRGFLDLVERASWAKGGLEGINFEGLAVVANVADDRLRSVEEIIDRLLKLRVSDLSTN